MSDLPQHTLSALATSAPAARTATPATTPDLAHRVGQRLDETIPCANDTDSADGDQGVTFGGTTVGPASAGSGRCDRARRVHGSRVSVNAPAALSPTGVQDIGVTSDYIHCDTIKSNPLVTCTPPTQQGAQP
jgi:hypothetical protein